MALGVANADRPSLDGSPSNGFLRGFGAAVERCFEGGLAEVMASCQECHRVVPWIRRGDEQGIKVAVEIEAAAFDESATIGQKQQQAINGGNGGLTIGGGAQSVDA